MVHLGVAFRLATHDGSETPPHSRFEQHCITRQRNQIWRAREQRQVNTP